MSSQSLLDQDKFWKVVNFLVALDHKKNFDDVCGELEIAEKQLNSYIGFLKDVSYEIETYVEDGIKKLCPPQGQPKIQCEFSLVEWLQFQAHFPALEQCKNKPFHQDFVRKLSLLEKENENHDLFSPLETLEEIQHSQQIHLLDDNAVSKNEVISFIEQSILEKQVIKVSFEDKKFVVYPRKIVFLDAQLCLVAEGLNDQCLLNINIDYISEAHAEDVSWKPIFTQIEVDDFVSSIRVVSETETRLVLKIYNRESFDSGLEHHFFANPCMFTNPNGDFIWAASIEPNDEIFEWLSKLGTDVEILDPINFKKEFLNYCEHKLKKLA